MPSLSLLRPLFDYWFQLREGTRDNIIGGLFVSAVVAVVVIFRRALFSAIKYLLTGHMFRLPENTAPAHSQPPQEFTFKFEGVQPVQPQQPPQKEPPPSVHPSPSLPRPPIAGFVARRDAQGHDIVSRLQDELSPEKDRLIVLWGAGGVGKTTLAAEASRSLRSDFAGRIIWISAEGRPDFSLSTLLDEIATYLERTDLRQLALAPKDDQVHSALATALPTLIVLDNFETVDPKEQDLCAEWLATRASCPALVTSRDEVAQARPIHILAMSLLEAREFLQNLLVQARNPRAFQGLDSERLIKAAGRIPLVLQWVVRQIDAAKQSQAVLEDLAHGEGDAAKRVFDRSFDLPQVGADGRAVLLALSHFVPSASRSALAEVAGFGDDHGRLAQAVRQLSELWLIETSERNERLSVEGLTRQLAKARLAKDDQAGEFAKRLVSYFRSYANTNAEPGPEAFEALEIEKDNVLNAIDVAFKIGDLTSVMTTCSKMQEFLELRGYWEDAIRSGKQALSAARKANITSKISTFAHSLGVLYRRRGELGQARQLLNESLEIKKLLGHERSIAGSLRQLARLAHEGGDLSEAQRLYNESLALSRKCGHPAGIASALRQMARIARTQGNRPEARLLYTESLAIEQRLFNQRGIARSRHELARLAQDEGQFDNARLLYKMSMEINQRLGNQAGIARTLNQLGKLEEGSGNMEEAARLFGEALAILEKLKSPEAEFTRQSLERVRGKSS